MSGSSRIESQAEDDHLFAIPAPDPDRPLRKDDERSPLWLPSGDPAEPLLWSVGSFGKRGRIDMTPLLVAFSTMPVEEARKRFKQELVKDFGMVDSKEEDLR